MIVRRIGQTEDAAGIILAVDGQPDGTVARKRFWRCNFLFAKSVAEVKAELQRVLASELATRKFSYPRSDGSAWTLTRCVAPGRANGQDLATIPNGWVDLRWGGAAQRDQAATCRRYAAAAQREKMSKYRAWFHERRRPPRA